MARKETYYEILTQAISEFVETGFDSIDRLNFWTERLRRAAEEMSSKSTKRLEDILRDTLANVYRRLIEKGELIDKYHVGVSRFTLARIKPELRSELDRRILASANLIKLNREQAIQKTLQRFQGWATSIPKGGTEAEKRKKVKDDIRKSMTKYPFEERRVVIDQSHKLVASINDIVATNGGAIALIWRSNWRQPNYNYRIDHKERDGLVYLLDDTWATKAGLVKPGKAGWYKDMTAVAQMPFCRCFAIYLYSLESLPEEMLTQKGKAFIAEAKLKAAAAA